jgi:hypothetical protein
MTLHEYLNQADPVWSPRVLLEENELNVLSTARVAGEERSLVTIRSEDPLLRSAHYLLIRNRLWAMDRDGNPRARSVFHLK